MADKKITELNALASADAADELVIVDVTAPAETKKITFANLTSTFLTSESDPVFVAHQAHNITAQMITDLGNLSGVNTGDQDLSGYSTVASWAITDAALTSHEADNTIHFTQATISIPASQISDFDTEVSNNSDVTTNSAKTSYTDAAVVAANTASCALIDPHIADETIHFTSNALWDAIDLNTAKTSYTKTNVKGHAFHDASGAFTRPTGFTSVEWVGSVEPTNADNGDTWIDTS